MGVVSPTPMSRTKPEPQPSEAPPLPHEDLSMVRAALGGDDAALKFLAERARIVPRVLRGLNRRWGGPLGVEDIEDLSQDVVVHVLEKLEAYQGLSPFDAWLYRFCSLQLRNRVRREVFRRRVVVEAEVEPAEQLDPTDQLDGKDLWAIVEELDPTDRDIIRAKHAQGLSFSEIAERFGAASSSVKTRYYRSLEQLRQRAKLQREPGRES